MLLGGIEHSYGGTCETMKEKIVSFGFSADDDCLKNNSLIVAVRNPNKKLQQNAVGAIATIAGTNGVGAITAISRPYGAISYALIAAGVPIVILTTVRP
jgi:hypothetical protein